MHPGCPLAFPFMEIELRCRRSGFTLVDLLMIMVITGILATYAVSRYGSAGAVTGASQAQRFARDLRHAQMLATTWSRQLCVSVTASDYSVHGTSGTPPVCDTAAVTDPATGADFRVDLEDNAQFTGTGTMRFDGRGRPSSGTGPSAASTSYTLSAGGASWSIAVLPVTGLVTVAP